jgi:protein TonB
MKGYFLPSSSDARALHIIGEEFVGGGDPRSCMFTTMFSVIIHGALFITFADPLLDLSGLSDREPTDRSINISFQRPAPPETVQRPEPKPQVTATPEPLPKPEPKPKVEQAPRPEVAKSAEVGQALMASDARKQTSQSYLSQILAKIERNKHYPKMARRRGTEGAIDINFMVLNDGTISTLKLNGGHKLLSIAARNAIKKSIPLPSPPSSPYQVAFTMRFELN